MKILNNLKKLLLKNINLSLILLSVISLLVLFLINFIFDSKTFRDYVLIDYFVLIILLVFFTNISKLFLQSYLVVKKDFNLRLTLENILREFLMELSLVNFNFILISIFKLNIFNLSIELNNLYIYLSLTIVILSILFKFITNFLIKDIKFLNKYLILSITVLLIFVLIIFGNLYTFLISIISGILSLVYLKLSDSINED